jgi:hypothetical protein
MRANVHVCQCAACGVISVSSACRQFLHQCCKDLPKFNTLLQAWTLSTVAIQAAAAAAAAATAAAAAAVAAAAAAVAAAASTCRYSPPLHLGQCELHTRAGA